jgi:ligand-binding sensor domain-containing protein/two-component sensor histidine kinase
MFIKDRPRYRRLLQKVVFTLWILGGGLLQRATMLSAQKPILRHLTDEQGLPCLAIYDLMEDERGFIWLGTDKGLYRYDGVFFKQMPNVGTKPNILTRLRKQRNGHIFGFNFGGDIGYFAGDSVRNFTQYARHKKGGLPSMAVDAHNDLWIGSEQNPLTRYRFKDKNVVEEKPFYLDKQRFDTASITSKGSYHAVINDHKVWAIEVGVLGYVDVNTEQVHTVHVFSNSDANAAHLYSTKSKVLLVSRNKNNTNSVVECTVKGMQTAAFWSQMSKENVVVNEFMEDIDGTIWVATSNGAWQLAADGRILQHLLENTIVGNVLRDREGQYWFCSPYDGVFCMASSRLQLLNYPSSVIRVAFDGQQHLYLGTADGKLLIFDIPKNQTVKTQTLAGKIDWQGMSWLAEPLNKLVFCRKSTFLYSGEGKQEVDFTKFSTDKSYVISSRRNGFFAASSYGAQYYDLTKKEVRTISSQAAQRYFAVKKRPDTGGGGEELWFAASLNFTRITGDSNTLQVPFPMGINDFCFADATHLWVATPQNGLSLVRINDNATLTVERDIKATQGLLGNRVNKIRQDTDGSLWLVVDGAVQHFFPQTNRFDNFSRANGLLSQELYDICLTDSTVWLASSKGLQYFPKLQSFAPSVLPLVYIERVMMGDRQFDPTMPPPSTDRNQSIEFNFTGISLLSNGRFTYQYRLLGADSSWTTTTATNNIARYQSLKSGDYTFEVQLITEDGRRSEVVRYAFQIRLPFWLQSWFYVVLAFLGIAGVTAYFLWMIRKLNERNLFEQRLANSTIENSRAAESQRRAQLSALKAQMNPHFIFNALNSIQAFIFLNDKQAANVYLGKFSSLIRRTLDMSQHETISLDEEIELLENYLSLEAMRFQNLLSWDIEVAPRLESHNVLLPPLLLQPYVENAIKHGLSSKVAKVAGDRHIHIYFKQEMENLICTIQDNGIGRANAQDLLKQRNPHHLSFSTSATEQRLALLNNGRKQKIYVEYEDIVDGEARGTIVNIII